MIILSNKNIKRWKRIQLVYFLALEVEQGVPDLNAKTMRDDHNSLGVLHEESDKSDS